MQTSEASWIASEGETEAVSKENHESHPITCVGGGRVFGVKIAMS